MHLMSFILICVCVKRAYVPECFCIGQLCAIAISGFITRLACPRFGQDLVHSLCDWISPRLQSLSTGFAQQLPDPLPD